MKVSELLPKMPSNLLKKRPNIQFPWKLKQSNGIKSTKIFNKIKREVVEKETLVDEMIPRN